MGCDCDSLKSFLVAAFNFLPVPPWQKGIVVHCTELTRPQKHTPTTSLSDTYAHAHTPAVTHPHIHLICEISHTSPPTVSALKTHFNSFALLPGNHPPTYFKIILMMSPVFGLLIMYSISYLGT